MDLPVRQFNRKQFWLEFQLEKSLKFELEILYTKEKIQTSVVKTCLRIKTESQSVFFKPKLKPRNVLLNRLPAPVVHVARYLDGGVGHVPDLVVPHRDVVEAGDLDAVGLPQVCDPAPVETVVVYQHVLLSLELVVGVLVMKLGRNSIGSRKSSRKTLQKVTISNSIKTQLQISRLYFPF